MNKTLIIIMFILMFHRVYSQPYTSYFTGNPTDISTTPSGGVCMMGGATEHDGAMQWFLQRANGGDILVLRTSGSNGYNDYMYSQLGISVNSVESIVCNSAAASSDPYVLDKISKAEAIWFAGGDQWNYVSYWRNTAVDSLLRDGITNRHIVIGGTSAGMAILGGIVFTAEHGSATSASALLNPYANTVTIDSIRFLNVPFMNNVITDTHYNNPDRRGRHVVFLARAYQDWGIAARGIACDEYVAVCIDTTGNARVFGDYPAYNENAYFIIPNCELPLNSPENCQSNQALNWYRDSVALNVCDIKGTNNGANTFDMNTWQTSNGGTWYRWYVSQGILKTQTASAPNCIPASIQVNTPEDCLHLEYFPGEIQLSTAECRLISVEIFDIQGISVLRNEPGFINQNLTIKLPELKTGIYFIKCQTTHGLFARKIFVL